MTIRHIIDDDYEVWPSSAEPFVVRANYLFDIGEVARLEFFEALLEDGSPANLDKETLNTLEELVTLDYVDYLVGQEMDME